MTNQSDKSSQIDIQEKFREVRKKHNISQESLALKLDISQNMVSNKETGRNSITADDISALEELVREKNKGNLPEELFEDFVDMYCSTGEIPPYAEPGQYREFVRLCIRSKKAVDIISLADRYIDVSQAAKILELSRQRVSVLAKEGRIESVMVGNTRMLLLESVIAHKSSPRKVGRPSKNK